MRPAARVACHEKNVVEDVRDLDRHVGVVDPRGGASVQFQREDWVAV